MIDVRPVLYINGFLLAVLAVAMCIPALTDFAYGDADWQAFAAAAGITGVAALVMIFGNRPEGELDLSVRQAFVLTTSIWVLTAAFGALPFFLSALGMSYTDGYFEAMSGLTTTGSTVIVGLDTAPKGIILWRALLNWLGGVGIIVVAVALLPILRIGGMQLFRMESSDKTDKVKPRVSQVAGNIVLIYVTFSLLCCLMLWALGMSFFDAIVHAMASLATGGFSSSDNSLGNWNHLPAIQWAVAFWMMVGGTTFVLFITPWKRNRWAILYDSQVRWYLAFLAFFSGLLAFWQWVVNDMPPFEALRHATFNVVSVVTTTGFASTDYSKWGGFAEVTFFILTFIGGCTGSTAGGIKIFRWQVLFAMAGVNLKRLLHPHGVFVIDFNKINIPDPVVRSVLGFILLFFFTFAALALALTMTGLDVITSLTGAAQALANVGPGLGDIIGPAGNFKTINDPAKWLLAFGMLLGRLELATVLVLLTRSFWRS